MVSDGGKEVAGWQCNAPVNAQKAITMGANGSGRVIAGKCLTGHFAMGRRYASADRG